MPKRIPNSSARTQQLFLKVGKIIALDGSRGASPETVHDLRTTARRIETLISAYSLNDRDSTKLAKQLASLRRRAGSLRDVDVHLAALDAIRLDNGVRDRALLRKHLTKMRNKREKKLMRALDKAVSKGIEKKMTRTEERLTTVSDGFRATDYLGQALSKFRNLAESHPHLTEATLHRFRIDCKRIRYVAEISSDPAAAKLVVSRLKSIQDAIGDWHDWLTLTEVATDVLPNTATGLMAALRTHTRSKYNEAIRVCRDATRELLAVHAAKTSPSAPSDRNGNRRKAADVPAQKDRPQAA